MITVKELIRNNSADTWNVSPDDTVLTSLRKMADHDVGAVLVVEGDAIKGIFTERDYARKVILKGRSSKTARVGDLMTDTVLYVHPENTLEECMALMAAKRVRHLPVLDGEQNILGVISMSDVVKKTIYHHEFMVEQLENYITGSRGQAYAKKNLT